MHAVNMSSQTQVRDGEVRQLYVRVVQPEVKRHTVRDFREISGSMTTLRSIGLQVSVNSWAALLHSSIADVRHFCRREH